MARFDVGGAQLAAVTRQPLFGQVDQDLEAVAAQYRQFQARFLPLCRLLDQPDAISDEQAFRIRLLVSDAYQHCRRADPLLPQELLPDGWQSMHAFRTYRALYGGCASPARRHFLRIMSAAAPDTRLSA
jgi:phenylacetic acid degradation operon negative regulatory protein